MPELCRFEGIVLRMYRHDHPPPHFHAIHGETEAVYGLDGTCMAGSLPRAQHKLVRAWARVHQAELERCWNRAQSDDPIGTIEPLP